MAVRPNADYGLLILEVSRSHTTAHHSQDSFGRVISSSQRPVPENTQHSKQTNIHAPSWIRTHNLSRRAAADLRLTPCGHWDRLFKGLFCVNTFATSYLNTQGLNNSCLKSPASTLVDLTFQSHALRSFSLNQLRNLSL